MTGTFRVLDLTTTLGGAYCGHLLASGGIDVMRAEPPGGHPLRRVERQRGGDRPTAPRVPLFSWLAGGRRASPSIPRRRATSSSCWRGRRRWTPSLWSPGARRRRRAAGGGGARRDGHGDHAVRADRAVGRPGGHRVHAAGAVRRRRACAGRGRGRRCRPAASTASTWPACSRAVATMHRAAARGRQRRGRGHRPVGARGRDDDPAVQPAHDGDAGRRRPAKRATRRRSPTSWRPRTATSGSPSSTGSSTGSDFCAMIGQPEWADDRDARLGRRTAPSAATSSTR